MPLLLNPEFWRSIPAIVSFLLELKKLWDEKISEEDRREKLQAFKDALAKARVAGDTGDLERLASSFKSS